VGRIEEIRQRAEGQAMGELGSAPTPKEAFEKGMDFAQLIAEDVPYLLQ